MKLNGLFKERTMVADNHDAINEATNMLYDLHQCNVRLQLAYQTMLQYQYNENVSDNVVVSV